MKKLTIGAVLFILLIAAYAFSSDKAASLQKMKSPQSIEPAAGDSGCKNTPPIAFELDGTNTVLSIPSSYLYKNFNPHRDGKKNVVKFISLKASKADFSPDCGRSEKLTSLDSLKQFVQITLSAKKSNADFLTSTKLMHPVFVRDIDDRFSLFRSKSAVETGRINEASDLLIPKDQKLAQKIYIECKHPVSNPPSEEWVGCLVFTELPNYIYVRYTIYHTDLEKYLALNDKVEKFVLGLRKPERYGE
ncbi:MAG: hypothetical protein EPN97_02900 [Alphaproteobacteria bacterium]|nr:MAG: hypothetical protein EPN97_02900 [Alphaproteobacteria bacterium]